MKVIILGGSGVIGSYAAESLVKEGNFSDVTIGDINIDKAKAAAELLGEKASYKKVDIYDSEQLREAIRGYDLVVNCIGPFYKNADIVIQASLDEKANFLDICDDYDAAELLLTYDQRFKEAGLLAVICAGASPGMMNILAAIGAGKLDETEAVDTSWIENSLDTVGATSVFYHAAHFVDGNIPQFLDGEQVYVPALSGTTEFEFPGIGTYPVHYVGHPEPVTLPKFIKGLKRATNRGNGYPLNQDYANGLLGFFAKLGLTSKDLVLNINGGQITPRDFLCHYLPIAAVSEDIPEEFKASEGELDNVGHFLIRVDVHGYKGEQAQHIVYLGTCGHTRIATGGTAAYIANLIGSGRLNAITGVVAPEGCVSGIDEAHFYQYLSSIGVELTQITNDEEPVALGI